MKNNAVMSLLGLAAVVGVIFLIVYLAGSMKFEKEETVEEDASSVVPVAVMEPVMDGEYQYAFEAIEWQFVEDGSHTRVNFMFNNFSRKEGAYITFGNPYKLGLYPGACTESDSLEYDHAIETGIPLGFVSCVQGESIQDIALFQIGEEVKAKVRSRVTGEESQEVPFSGIYTINLTEIVE